MGNKKCSICGNIDKIRTIKHNGVIYCNRHYMQIRRYGKIKTRTILTKNEIRIKGDICEMDLYDMRCNVVGTTIFDKKFLSLVKKSKWSKIKFGYIRHVRKGIMLHRLIIGAKDNEIVDHINRNPLDNKLCNLRIVNDSQNAVNKRIQSNNTSGYPGITFDKKNKKWKARLNYYKKSYWLGRFKDIKEAIKVREEKMNEIFKEHKPII